TKQFLVEAKEKYGVSQTSFGGTLQGKIRVILLSVSSKKYDCTIDEARKLLVSCVEDYLAEINNNQKLRPHLSHYPFSDKGIQFGIGFHARDDDAIRHIFLLNGNVCYSSTKEGEGALERKHKETYEEAKEKVMAGRSAAVGS
ncbi:MAG: hypothetical protein HRU43_01490, partial [Simkaniaceae bacterium]|nr:hypothetical protein [Simkaniaceae bacterium]